MAYKVYRKRRTTARKAPTKKKGGYLSRGLKLASYIPGPIGAAAELGSELAGALGLKRQVRVNRSRKHLGQNVPIDMDATVTGGGTNVPVVTPGQLQSGPIASGSDVPVAYGRNQLNFDTSVEQVDRDSILVRVLEPSAGITQDAGITPGWIPCLPAAGVGGTFDLCNPIHPMNTFTNPWLSQLASDYEYYRLKKLAFHLIHYVPTSTPGSITLFYTGDVNYNADGTSTSGYMNLGDATALTQQEVQSSSQWAMSAVYEDMCFEVKLEQPWNDWKYNMLPFNIQSGGGPAVSDPRLNFAGYWYAYYQNVDTSTTPAFTMGDLFIEFEVEFKMRKLSTVTAGLLSDLKTISAMAPEYGTIELEKCLAKVKDRYLRKWLKAEKKEEKNTERRLQREKREALELAEALELRKYYEESRSKGESAAVQAVVSQPLSFRGSTSRLGSVIPGR